MKRPSVIEGIFLAAGLLLVAFAALVGCGFLFGLKAAVGASVSLYLLYLLWHATGSVGRVSFGIFSAALLILGLAPSIGLAHYFLGAAALIWLVRVFYFYSGVIPAVLDGLLCLGALFCAGASLTLSRGGILVALWVFFLIQAAFVLIPERIARRPKVLGQGASAQIDPFAAALRSAEEALRRL